MILAEKDGKTQFSYLKVIAMSAKNIPTKVEPYNNIYNIENDEDLPNGPLKIHEHFCSDPSTIGQLLLLTKNGGYDINGLDFKKEIPLSDAFDGKSYPDGFGYAKEAMFMSCVDVVADMDGHLYSRIKNTSELFHSGFFLHEKLRIKGETEDLKGCRLIRAPFHMQKACLVYEEPKKRFLLVTDGGTGGFNNPDAENAGRPITLGTPTEDVPEGFLPLTNIGDDAEILSIDYYSPETYGNMAYAIIFVKEGKTYYQSFEIEKDFYSLIYTVVNPKFGEIKGLPSKPTFAYTTSYLEYNPLSYIAVDNKLYVYDNSNLTLPVVQYIPKDQDGKLVDVFSGDIKYFDAENYYSRWATVGLSDGRALIIKTISANYPEDQIVLYDSGAGVYGNIADVRCKLLGGNSWEVN